VAVQKETDMASELREHMKVIDAEGAPIGTIDRIEGDRIKLTRKDDHGDYRGHHFIPRGLVAEVEGDTVRLSAKADALESIFESGESEVR
jgi:hypothetical protein